VHPLRDDEEYIAGGSQDRSVVLYHLHGSIAWLREQSGLTWKAHSLDRLRELDYWRTFGRDQALLSPAVVLTDQKQAKVQVDPFAWSYRRLRAALGQDRRERPDRILIAGYGFGDEPLNAVLRNFLPYTSCPVVVIDKRATTDELKDLVLKGAAASARDRSLLEPRLRLHVAGLPDAIQHATWQ
jgi:hypothetical protein